MHLQPDSIARRIRRWWLLCLLVWSHHDMRTRLLISVTLFLYAAIVLASMAIALGMGGCANAGRGAKGEAPTTKAVAATVGEVATGIGSSADRIDVERLKAETKAPEVATESAAIGEETAKLRAMRARLDDAATDLLLQQARIDSLARKVSDLEGDVKERDAMIATRDAELAEAKAKRDSILVWMLSGLIAASVVGAIAAIFFLRSFPLAGACGAVALACIGTLAILPYALWIGLGLGAVLVAVGGYALWRMRGTIFETAATAEAFKKVDPTNKDAMKRAAETLQSEFTKKLLSPVLAKMHKEAEKVAAFGGAR